MPSEDCWLHLGVSSPCAVSKVNCHGAWCAPWVWGGRGQNQEEDSVGSPKDREGGVAPEGGVVGPVQVLSCGLCRLLKAGSLGLQAPPGQLSWKATPAVRRPHQFNQVERNICSLNFLPLFSSPDICQVSRCVLCRGKKPTPLSEALFPTYSALPQSF